MVTRYFHPFVIVVLLTTSSMLFSSCTPRPTAASPLASIEVVTPTDTLQPGTTQTTEPSPTATHIPLPVLTWNPGYSYFSLNGRPAFLCSKMTPAGELNQYIETPIM